MPSKLETMFDADYVPDADGSIHGALRALLLDIRKLADQRNIDFEGECDGSDADFERWAKRPRAHVNQQPYADGVNDRP